MVVTVAPGRTRTRTQATSLALVFGVMTPGCIITAADADGDGGTESSATSPSTTTPNPVTSVSAGETDPEEVPLPEGCSDNLLLDPGFEGGSPSAAWEEASALFGTPVCNAACTDDEGAAPLSGGWWVWFGGIEELDTASVAQTVVFPEGTGILRFGFQINASSGAGTDTFAVEIDGNTVFMATDAQLAQYAAWSSVEIDVSEFANGGEHVIRFAAQLSGAGVTNFFLDDTLLVSCSPSSESASSSGPGPGSSSGTSTGPSSSSGSSMGETEADTGSSGQTGASATETDSGTTMADSTGPASVG